MKKVNLNVVGFSMLALATVSLFRGLEEAFLLFMVLSSAMFGAGRMNSLIEGKSNVKQSNIRLAFLGVIFGIASMFTPGVFEVVFSFAFGTCFGLIGVGLIFQKNYGEED